MKPHVWDVLRRMSRVHAQRGALWYDGDGRKLGRWWLGDGNEVKLHSTAWFNPKDMASIPSEYIEHVGGMYSLTRAGRAAITEHFSEHLSGRKRGSH